MSTKRNGNANGHSVKFHGFPTYFFRQNEQDPIIDRVFTILKDDGVKIAKASVESGVSPTTLHNWENGKTRRPQFCTVAAVLRSRGYDFACVPIRGPANPKKNWAAVPPRILIGSVRRNFYGKARTSDKRRSGVLGP